eukprot:7860106-Alexandrium_andersonii.AAC.1
MCIRDSLGPRSSSSEHPRRVCMFRMADCGVRRIAAVTGLGRIADWISGTLPCKDPRIRLDGW